MPVTHKKPIPNEYNRKLFITPHVVQITLDELDPALAAVIRAGGNGSTGPQGPQGLPGRDGQDGRDGERGEPGAASTIPGPQGEPGRDGQDGYIPVKGVDYFDGSDGVDGRDGTNGAPGDKGDPGNDGAASTIPGPQGIQGPPGNDGQDGADSTVPGPKGDKGDAGNPGTTDYAQLTNVPSTFAPSTHNQAISTITDLQTTLNGKEAANANIQAHVTAAHAPSNAQANADITKAEIEAKLTGAISSHSHAASGQPIGFAVLSNDTLAQALATNICTRVTVTAARTLTTTVPAAGIRCTVEILTSGTTSFTVTFGSGFKPVGTLATGTTSGRIFSVNFLSDGTNLHETGRTAAMVA